MPKTVPELLSEYRTAYNGVTLASKTDRERLVELSLATNGTLTPIQFYFTATIVNGIISIFRATGNRTYLNDAIEIYDNFVSVAAPSNTLSPNAGFNDTYESWVLDDSGTPVQFSLHEVKMFKEFARLCWLLKDSPNLRAETNVRISGETYQDFYNRAVPFIETHIWEKWEVRSIGQLYNGGVDKDIRAAELALYLWDITGTQKYKDKVDAANSLGNPIGETDGGNFKGHLEVNTANANAVQWDRLYDNSVFGGDPQNGLTAVNDAGHSGHALKFPISDYEINGFWTLEDFAKFIQTLYVWWPDPSLGDTCFTFIDGTTGTNDNQPLVEGFTSLARYDESLQEDFEAYNGTYLYNDRAESCFLGELAENRAFINNAVQFPENYYTTLVREMPTSIKAFPTSQGGGSNITGGRGGTVIHVTNLNNSGSGSLREALTTSGARTIVFDVSGNISLSSIIEIPLNASNFTIAGQTAPEGGITVTGAPIQMGGGFSISTQECNNGIWRFIRFRNNTVSGSPDQYLENGFISTGSDGIVISNCSFSFNADQHISLNGSGGGTWDMQNISIQDSLFGECDSGIVISSNTSSGTTGDISVNRNLFVHSDHRHPNVSDNGRWDILNNVIFNWDNLNVNINTNNGPDVNFIANHMQTGSFTGTANNIIQSGFGTGLQLYTANNFHNTLYTTPELDDRLLWTQGGSPPSATYFTTTQHILLENTELLTALEAYDKALSDTGANAYVADNGTRNIYRDSYDTQLISDIQSLTSRDPDNTSWTLPTIPNNTRPVDFYNPLKSFDIPEFFWDEHSITSDSEVKDNYIFDGITVPNAAGYTAFEMWLIYAAQDDLKFPTQGTTTPTPPDDETIIIRKRRANIALTMSN